MSSAELLEVESIIRKVAAELYWAMYETLPTPEYALDRTDAYFKLCQQRYRKLLTRRDGVIVE